MSDPTWYPVRLGPLRFEGLADYQTTTIAGRLDSVGAVLVPAEATPVPVNLALPVRGAYGEADPREAGIRLRRQVNALLSNDAWLSGGLYYEAGWDPESRAWLRVAGGELVDEGLAWPLGEWRLNLSSAFLAGRPPTARRGRSVVCVDRAAQGVASDTRRQLYTTDRSSWPDQPQVVLPSGGAHILGLNGRMWPAADGPLVDGRRLWRAGEALNGEGLGWVANPITVPGPAEIEANLEDWGSVRAWSLPLGDATTMTPAGDRDPELYGWERVLGQLSTSIAWNAVDNGWCRIVWRGADAGTGLHLERWTATGGGQYVPVARLTLGLGMSETRIVELTPERAVISWRIEDREMRAILQRGWPGPRIEMYGSPTARLAVTGPGTVTREAVETGVDRITTSAGGVLCATSHNAVAWSGTTSVAPGWTGEWAAPRVLAVQLDVHNGTAADLKRLARWDVQPQPILMTR